MVMKPELCVGSALTLFGVAEALVEREWNTFFYRPFQWVDKKLPETNLEEKFRSAPLNTHAKQFLPHFLLVIGPTLLCNSFINKRIHVAPLIFCAVNSLHELAQLLSPKNSSQSPFFYSGDAEWKDFFAGVGGAGLAAFSDNTA